MQVATWWRFKTGPIRQWDPWTVTTF